MSWMISASAPASYSPPRQPARLLDFVVAQDGIQGDKDLRAEAMGEVAQARDIGDLVAGAVAGAEDRAADIDGIGAVPDGLDTEVGILRRGEEFERMAGAGHAFSQ